MADKDSIVRALEDEIMFGNLMPNSRIIEDDLMKRFAAKRHTAREAINDLIGIGVITKERNKSAMVRSFSAHEVEKIYEMRELLQASATDRISLPAEPTLIAQLEAVNQRFGEAIADDNLRQIFQLNNEFHSTLFSACGNSYLVDAIEYYSWLSHTIRSFRIADPNQMEKSLADHVKMIRAMRGDSNEALTQICLDHIKPSKEAYLRTQRLLEKASQPSQDLAEQTNAAGTMHSAAKTMPGNR